MKADVLVLGNVVTLDPRNPIFKACCIKNGLVQYVGSVDTAKKLCDDNTRILDYGDNYIYPGFIEGHCHGAMAGPRLKYFARVNDGKSMDEYVDIMRKYIQDNPGEKHYWGAGWQILDKEPTAEMLDAICNDIPVCLNSVDGHSMWMNHKAMEYFNINKESIKQWGSNIVRENGRGEPTGYISEGPATGISLKMLSLSMEEKKIGMLKWQEYALSHGITAYYEAGVNERTCEMYRELIADGNWKLRVYAGYMMDENSEDYAADVHKAKELADKYNCEYFQIIGLKLFMDGVVEAHTAWTIEGYSDQPEYTGVKRFCDLEKTVELYKEAEKVGFSVHQHTVGDGAVKFALDCIERAQLETGNMNMRNAVAHLQLVRPEDVKRICDLNVIAVVAPLWMSREPAYYEQTESYIGKRRAFFQYPLQSFVNQSGILAFHTDYPVSSAMSIPQSIYCAQERNNPDEDVYSQLNYHEAISREDAIAGLTLGPAYEVKQEDRLGRLMIGYVANMSVFDKNFLDDDIEDVAKAKIVATIIDGKEAYRA